eukprot:GHVU01232520.1.p1 GENE.GHVU01232520.1~~GHVU01232520.1.p1  ORF type:complete len:292 (-),score=18.60 GHVU01232520.1:751-1626(-)
MYVCMRMRVCVVCIHVCVRADRRFLAVRAPMKRLFLFLWAPPPHVYPRDRQYGVWRSLYRPTASMDGWSSARSALDVSVCAFVRSFVMFFFISFFLPFFISLLLQHYKQVDEKALLVTVKKFGQGGHGQVFQALELSEMREVAVKWVAGDAPDLVFDLLSEAGFLALIDHPFVVQQRESTGLPEGGARREAERRRGRTRLGREYELRVCVCVSARAVWWVCVMCASARMRVWCVHLLVCVYPWVQLCSRVRVCLRMVAGFDVPWCSCAAACVCMGVDACIRVCVHTCLCEG